VVDTRVQGEFAERSIAAAITTLSRARPRRTRRDPRRRGPQRARRVRRRVDRRAIAASPIPVLTGLGHEVDRSVADEVAHTTLKTPTACAGELIARAARYSADTEAAFAAIVRASSLALTAATTDLSETAHRIARRTHAAVERADERLGMRVDTLAHAPRRPRPGRPAPRRRTDGCSPGPDAHPRASREPARRHRRAGRRVDPAVQLARGWSITRAPTARSCARSTTSSPTTPITIAVADGHITSTVNQHEEEHR
jgi:exodeoxyribonuclease VII large subunit